jgi:transcriptional regulator with XRE-family HTH domain
MSMSTKAKGRLKKGRKKISGKPRIVVPPSPLPAFWDKVALVHGLSQKEIAKRGKLNTTYVNHVFQGRRKSIKDLSKIAKAMNLSFRQCDEMRRVWTADKWKLPVSKTRAVKPKLFPDRIDDLEKQLQSALIALRQAQRFLESIGAADHVAVQALVTSITTTALPAVDEVAKVIEQIQNEIAVIREKLVRRVYDLQHPPAKAEEPSDGDGSIPYDGELD